ncbi:MAG: hypothetical protein ACD_4C00267G0003 [uncultured bacterium (gcode 4)]|uniref:30S ribosomal protein S21 n=1 Tax=uncultured bacterium (gcode 4) TaxID=1234023 RepID=K2GT00_9BACT|nr:MAG: hypothetical protein ACD_4C00267G0003 [uncultured bacterium (gcode 4)]
MIIYAFKNKNESNEKLILRYKKMFFQTRLTNKLRNERYNVKWLTDRKVREKAIIRGKYRELNRK